MGAGTLEHHHTVLLVDDDEDLREAVAILAVTHGVNAIAVAGADDALSRLRNGLRPCLIVLDLSMPGKDGLAFRREQMSDPQFANIPIVVMSGAGSATEEQARKLGLRIFLRKPADPADLLRLFGTYCAATVVRSPRSA